MWMLNSGDGTLAAVAIVLAVGVLWAPIYSPEAAFAVRVVRCTRALHRGLDRVSGGRDHLSGTAGVAGHAAGAVDAIQPWYVASYVVVGCAVSAVSAMLIRPRSPAHQGRSHRSRCLMYADQAHGAL